MNRIFAAGLMIVAVAGAAMVAPGAGAAQAPLVEPMLAQSRAAPAEWVQIGLKAARPGVVITSATVCPREAKQFLMPLNDSGVMGDKAGDGIWSLRFPVPDATPPGFYWLDFEAQVTADGQPQKATVSVQVEIVKGEGRAVQIITPKAGATISGPVEVVVKLATLIPPDRVLVYLGAASAQMQRQGDVWTATLDTTRAGNGRQRLIAMATPPGTSADAARQQAGAVGMASAASSYSELPVIVRNPYQYYWGDLHAHTMYSDGVQTPADAYRHARDVAKIDFFAVTDHDGSLTLDEYADIRRQADACDKPGAFAALWGMEWTTDAGHMCVLMCDRFRLSGDVNAAYRELGELGVTAHFNHPAATDFYRGRYAPEGAGAMCGAEVRDAEEEASWIAMLNAGWRVAPDGSQDKHDATWGDGPHWTVALARELSREGIVEALRARRFYSSRDRNLRLEFTLDGEDMGAAVSRAAGKLPCVVSVSDPDAGDTIARMEAVVDGKIVASASPAKSSCRWIAPISLNRGRHYVYVRVTETDGNQAWSSPVWVQAQ